MTVIFTDNNTDLAKELICTLANEECKVLVISPTLRHSNIIKGAVQIQLDSNLEGLVFMPIGDGSKARGFRADNIVFYNATIADKEAVSTIIRGFTVVHSI